MTMPIDEFKKMLKEYEPKLRAAGDPLLIFAQEIPGVRNGKMFLVDENGKHVSLDFERIATRAAHVFMIAPDETGQMAVHSVMLFNPRPEKARWVGG